MDLDQMMTTKEVAEYLGLTEQSVRLYLNRGTLKGHQFGRTWMIALEDLQAFAAIPRPPGRPPKLAQN